MFELDELRSLRQRVYSLENRLLQFERTTLELFQDLLPLTPVAAVSTLPTPAEIAAALQQKYPGLQAHPTLWADIAQIITDDRRAINQIFQQEQGNAAQAFRRRIEELLHPGD